jgi:hypothetical protein
MVSLDEPLPGSRQAGEMWDLEAAPMMRFA